MTLQQCWAAGSRSCSGERRPGGRGEGAIGLLCAAHTARHSTVTHRLHAQAPCRLAVWVCCCCSADLSHWRTRGWQSASQRMLWVVLPCCRFVPSLRGDGIDVVIGVFKALCILGGECCDSGCAALCRHSHSRQMPQAAAAGCGLR